MDKLTSMKVFIAVAERGSFTAAADTLAMSKAMASKHVRYLENLLGARLLDRNTRRLRLTEVGAAYRDRCLRHLAEIEETERSIAERNAAPKGMLKVTAPTSFGTFHLTPAIADYKAACPEVDVQLTLDDRYTDLLEGGCDVAVRVGWLPESTLIARQLATAQLVVCGAPAYFDRHGVPQAPAELDQHNCLRYTQSRPRNEWLFKGPEGEFSVPIAGDFEANIPEAVRVAALSAQGLAQLATYVVGPDVQAGRLQAVLTDYAADPLPIHALYPDRRHLAATTRTFVDFLLERFQARNWEMEDS